MQARLLSGQAHCWHAASGHLMDPVASYNEIHQSAQIHMTRAVGVKTEDHILPGGSTEEQLLVEWMTFV